MYISSQINGWTSTHTGILRWTWFDPDHQLLHSLGLSELENTKTEMNPIDTSELLYTASRHSIGTSSQTCDSICITIPESASSPRSSHFWPRPQPSSLTEVFVFSSTLEQAHETDTMQFNRWRLAGKAVQMYPALRKRFSAKCNTDARKEGFDWFKPMT